MGSHRIVLSMRKRYINAKALKEELRNKTHGTIVDILIKLERMFKFKIMASLHKKGTDFNVKKLDFSTKKATKSLPEWWSAKWDHAMVDGTLQYGWGNVPSQFVREQYEFTPTYKGVKKEKKLSKKEQEALQKAEQAAAVKALSSGLENVKIDTHAPSEEQKQPSSPQQLIVKKRT